MRRFSLGTLLLVVTMAAVGASSLRNAIAAIERGESQGLLVLVAVGALLGCVYCTALTLWTRGWSWILLVSPWVGLYAGAAAGAQFSARVAWPVALLPLVAAVLVMVAVGSSPRAKVARLVPDDWSAGTNPRAPTSRVESDQTAPDDSSKQGGAS